MKNTLKLDRSKGLIIMDRTFAKLSENTRSEEYAHLQQVRRDYPTYTVVLRQIKKNPNKECYKGLTYDYMYEYILRNEPVETRKAVIDELDEMILISKCHSKAKRYPVIKNWFLEKYPEIVEFGMPTIDVPVENKIKKLPTTQDQNLPKASGLS